MSNYFVFFYIFNMLHLLRNLCRVKLLVTQFFDIFMDNSGRILKLIPYQNPGLLGMFMFIYGFNNPLFLFWEINFRFATLGDALPSVSFSCTISSYFLIPITIYNKGSMTSINSDDWKLCGTWNKTYNWKTEEIENRYSQWPSIISYYVWSLWIELRNVLLRVILRVS